jgi:hypothetical protein
MEQEEENEEMRRKRKGGTTRKRNRIMRERDEATRGQWSKRIIRGFSRCLPSEWDKNCRSRKRMFSDNSGALQLHCSGRLNARALVRWLAGWQWVVRAGVSQTHWRRACIPALGPSQTSYLLTMHQCPQVNVTETVLLSGELTKYNYRSIKLSD